MIYKALMSARTTSTGTTCVFRNPLTLETTTVRFPSGRVNTSNIQRWVDGEYIQDAMPHLSPEERELFLNGGLGNQLGDE